METDLLSQIIISATKFYHSTFLSVVKFFLGIYVAVLLVDLVLVIILKGLGGDIREMIKGVKMPVAPRGVIQRKWTKIKRRLESDNPSQYKAAILEADTEIDKILSSMGYLGENLSEKLKKIKPGQLPDYEELKNAHEIRNRIIYEADFAVDRKQAKEIIGVYENVLKNLELL